MKYMFLLLLGLLSSGCAFTVHDVTVDYSYDKEVSADLSGVELSLGDFTDARNVENPRMIMNQKNGYGQTTTGGWQAEKPLVDIVKDAVTDGLEKSGIELSGEASKMVLTAELLSFDGDIKMGAWVGSYFGKISVKMQLTDKQTGDILWRDTFIGSGEAKGKGGVESTLRVSLDNFVDNLLNDQYFRQKVATR